LVKWQLDPVNTKISIISVYNNRKRLEEFLLNSLPDKSDINYELILVDNRSGLYDSAASALNEGAKRADGEYYMFVHQDVKFLNSDWLESTYSYLESLDDLGVAGITGMSSEGERPATNARNTIFQGDEKAAWELGTNITSPSRVQTVDEFCIIIPSVNFQSHKFDAETCPGWHLYGVEYCLRMIYIENLECYVLPIQVWHGSTGLRIGQNYYRTLLNVAGKYSDYTKWIYTTCGTWPASASYIHHVKSLSRLIESCLPGRRSDKVLGILPLVYGLALPLIMQNGVRGLIYFLQGIKLRIAN
jgi:glycosyltransferase involved in cell wall biosynthesis